MRSRPALRIHLAAALAAGIVTWSLPAHALTSIQVSRAEPQSETVNPSSSFSLRLSFSGISPTPNAQRVQLQFLDANGNTAFSAEHDPAVLGDRRPTSAWVGSVSYVLPSIAVPAVAAGTYRIAVSLLDPATGTRTPLNRLASDIYTADLGSSRYQVGLLTVTNKRIVDANIVCNGVTDVSAGLRSAFDGMQPGDLLRLPAGTCVYSTVSTPPADNCTSQEPLPLRLPYWLQNAAVVGRGMPSTTLKALNVDASAMFADNAKDLQIRDLSISVESAGQQRRLCPVANGISIFNSQSVDIDRVQIIKPAAAGVLLYGVQDTRVQNSRMMAPMADGIQASHASQRVTMNSNYIVYSGDDALSSTGYEPYYNQSITITNNTVVNSGASGVAVEGTNSTIVKGNTVQGAQVAGLRVASIVSWKTGPVNGLIASDNTFSGVRRNNTVDHAAVMIFADHGNLNEITVSGNRIHSLTAFDGIRVRGSLNPSSTTPQYWASNVTITNNALTSGAGQPMRRCVHTPLPNTVINALVSGNTLNGIACTVNN